MNQNNVINETEYTKREWIDFILLVSLYSVFKVVFAACAHDLIQAILMHLTV